MTTPDDQLNATVPIPVHLLQYIDQECIIANGDDAAREAYNAALDTAFPTGRQAACGGYISWDLREAEVLDAEEQALRYERAKRIVDQAVADGRLIRRGDGPSSNPTAWPAASSTTRPTHAAALPAELAREGSGVTTT